MLVLNLPVPLFLYLFFSKNLALLFYASGLSYYLVYEWLHLLHHVPADTWIGRRPLVRWLRRHHQAHHDLRQMSDGNFNVSFPLWDYLLGSRLPDPEVESPSARE